MATAIAIMAVIFALTAALYASVGFGGGSTYIALLAIAEVDYRLLPIIALICNIIVVSGGSWRFHQSQLIEWRRIWPILIVSVPAAWLGGRIAIAQESFLILLGISLIAAAILLWIEPKFGATTAEVARPHWSQQSWFAPLAGGAIGFLSGLVGIGGGIFLAPLLLLTRWSDSRRIAATASVFILVNSIGGLGGQLAKTGAEMGNMILSSYWPLLVGVFVGGQFGSILAARLLPERWIKRLTAILIFYVAVRILVI